MGDRAYHMSLEDRIQQRNEKVVCQKKIENLSHLRWQSLLKYASHAYGYGEE